MNDLTRDDPEISVIIPTYNSEKTINIVLNTLTTVNYDRSKIEVIIVDSASSDSTLKILEEFKEKYESLFKCIKIIKLDSNYGVSYARNLGLKISTCELIFLLDSDVALYEDTLRELVNILKQESNIGAVAALYLTPQSSIIEKARWCKNIGKIGQGDLPTGAALIKREVIEKIGYFNEKLGYPFTLYEDTEYSMRLRKAGLRIIINGRNPLMHIKIAEKEKGNSLCRFRQEILEMKRVLRSYFTLKKTSALYHVLKVAPLRYKIEYIIYGLLAWTIIFLIFSRPILSLIVLTLSLFASVMYYIVSCKVQLKIRIIGGLFILASRVIKAFILSIYVPLRIMKIINHFDSNIK